MQPNLWLVIRPHGRCATSRLRLLERSQAWERTSVCLRGCCAEIKRFPPAGRWPITVWQEWCGKKYGSEWQRCHGGRDSVSPNKWASLIHYIGRVYSKCGAQKSLPPGRHCTFAELNPVSKPSSFPHSPLSIGPSFPLSFFFFSFLPSLLRY